MLRLIYFILFVSACSYAQEFTHNVYFDTDKYTVSFEEEKKFNNFISKLDSVAIDKITIFGFCDDRGTDAYNLWLSKMRAKRVKWHFSDHEFSDDLITIIDGKGEVALDSLKPKDVFSTRQINRRVEILVTTNQLTKGKDSIEIPTAQEILSGELNIGDKVRLKNIYFKTGFSTIVPESIPTLKEIAKILVDRKDIYFTVQGHVCCTHDTYDAIDRKTNKRNLSVARAKFIYTYLLKQGVDKKRMKYVGLRRKYPLGGDKKFDRRVEIEITYVANKN
ncbi:MAG: OmpA family protein [Bacteroidia bacterium]|nr:OmpA family protein [Bacteroidia bacterium]NND25763.1 OmpA family protein [Flavobacteriaceae bacterium]MBT8277385.1 OmpA family protein [Bacteroidia bacterium]NNK59707.1 OmpA family protein [Flavobacteriaceae bacterium]NNL32272.1 OmpA family protein [Flavobacteriaceae bacterium]